MPSRRGFLGLLGAAIAAPLFIPSERLDFGVPTGRLSESGAIALPDFETWQTSGVTFDPSWPSPVSPNGNGWRHVNVAYTDLTGLLVPHIDDIEWSAGTARAYSLQAHGEDFKVIGGEAWGDLGNFRTRRAGG